MVDTKLLRQLGEDWPAPVVLRVQPQPVPAAGADFSVVVPGEGSWGIVAVSATFTASAAAANRLPVMRVTDGSSVLFRVPALVAITAGLAVQVSWVCDYGLAQTALSANTLTIGLPPVYLAPGNAMTVATTAIDVGDQWSNIVVTAVEVLNGHVERERGLADQIRDESDAIAGIIEGKL